MHHQETTFQQVFLSHLASTFSLTPEQVRSIALTLHDDEKKRALGDLSTNAAMVLAKIAGKPPREIAEIITSTFKHPHVASMSIAGPGFINITLTQEAWNEIAQKLFTDLHAYLTIGKGIHLPHYSVEFVSANPTGPLHLGHGRGGIIGDVLGNILRYLGYPVTKEFYINDAGKQIATLGISFKVRCQQALGIAAELPEDGYHGAYLVELANDLLSADRASVERAIETSDNAFFATYAKDHLLKKITATLRAYGITFDQWFSEKSLHDQGLVDAALKRLTANGHTFEEDGALWFRSTTFGDDKDRVLRRSNGEVTYAAADVAYMLSKLERGAEKLVLVLGQDHHSYVIRLKGIMQALGYNPDNIDVILYQLVTLKEEGELIRMSKRAGRIVSLEDVIEEVGPDVARFFYLNRKPDAHLDFDISLALQHTEENPVYYLQYAFVRINSILEKAAEHADLRHIDAKDCVNFEESEKLLLNKILALKSLLANICENYQVHLVTYYVLELAHQFHAFYAANKVINPGDITTSRRRLALLKTLHETFGCCFDIIGISKPEKM